MHKILIPGHGLCLRPCRLIQLVNWYFASARSDSLCQGILYIVGEFSDGVWNRAGCCYVKTILFYTVSNARSLALIAQMLCRCQQRVNMHARKRNNENHWLESTIMSSSLCFVRKRWLLNSRKLFALGPRFRQFRLIIVFPRALIADIRRLAKCDSGYKHTNHAGPVIMSRLVFHRRS